MTIPSKRPTKIRVVGMSENLTYDQLIGKMRSQNPDLLNSNSVLDVVSTFKFKENNG